MTYDANTSIKTPAIGTPAQWIAALQSHGAQDAERIVAAYFKYGAVIGYNADLALAQACLECTWFTDWKWTTNRSPAGIGSTSRDVPGNVFPSIEAGISAQYAHQAAYAESAGSCPIEKMTDPALWNDPRHLFHKNTPQIVAWNGAWAVPGTTYAQGIAAIANAVVGVTPVPTPTPDLAITDVRGQLPTNPSGGSGTTFGPKQGVIIHYSAVNYPADRPMMDIMVSEANYHIGPYLKEAGLAYHYVVDPQTGDIYQARDENAVLWHCGAWPENQTWYSVHIPGGDTLVMSDVALNKLDAFCQFLAARDGFDAGNVKGHKEVSSTACPGPLMDQFVLPYRAGTLAPVTPPPAHTWIVDGKDVGEGIYNLVHLIGDEGAKLRLLGTAQNDQHDEYIIADPTPAQRKRGLNHIALPVVVVEWERGSDGVPIKIFWDHGRTPAPWDVRCGLSHEYIGPADDPFIQAVLHAQQGRELAAMKGKP